MRHRLHAIPEESGAEKETASVIVEALEELGLEVTTGIAGHGVLATLGDDNGPRRLLRCELDAVRGRDGIGHHCGHDGHMAMLMGALAQLADRPPRPLAALFQPAEETGEGLAACLEDPALQALDVEDAFAIHNIPHEPLGTAILGPGAMASVGMRVRFYGRSSHAAYPEQGASPWEAMVAWATRVRAAPGPDPLATLVHARLGQEAFGTSPGEGVAAATLRASDDDVLEEMWHDLQPQVGQGVEATVEAVEPFPATRNDPRSIERLQRSLAAANMPFVHRDTPFSWSEDFGHALQRWPGALVGLGSGEDQAPLHDSAYAFPDGLLAPGIRLWQHIASIP